MKYKAVKISPTQYAVAKGPTRYFISTVSDTEQAAKQQACIMSAKWYQAQMDKCQVEWEEASKQDLIDTEEREAFEYSAPRKWNDLLA